MPVDLCRHHLLLVEAEHIVKLLQVGRQLAVAHIVACRERQPRPRRERIAQCSVAILLVIMVVDASCILVFRIVGTVAQILVGVLGIHLHMVMLLEVRLIGGLHEEVAVPLAAHVDILVAQSPHDTARAATLTVVIINVRGESTLEQGSLDASVANVAVGTTSHGIFILRMIAEGIVATRVGPLTIDEAAPALSLKLDIRLRHIGSKRSSTQLHRQRILCGSSCT